MKLEYHPAVEEELRAIKEYYNEQAPGLGEQFLDEFERSALAIASKPERWMIVEKEIRRCLMRRFPYIIYFRKLDSETVRITVVKHQRRHPSLGRERS